MTSTPAGLASCVHRLDGVAFTVAVHEVYAASRSDGSAVLRAVISATAPGKPDAWLLAERPICHRIGTSWVGLRRIYSTFAALDTDRSFYPPDYPHPQIHDRPGHQIQRRIEQIADATGLLPCRCCPSG